MRVIVYIVIFAALSIAGYFTFVCGDFCTPQGAGEIDGTTQTPDASGKDSVRELPRVVESVRTAARTIASGPLKVLSDDVSTAPVSRLTVAGVLVETNLARVEEGLPPLSLNLTLSTAADSKTADMFSRQYFEHVSPSGEDAGDIVSRAGYAYLVVGENLALGNFKDDRALVAAWLASPGHRANILNAKFQEIGVAVRRGTYEGRNVWIAVQEFGRPRSACPAVEENLRRRVEENTDRITSLTAILDTLKQQIDAAEPKAGREYQEKIEHYNQLVVEHNELVKATKDLIDQYNESVKQFNSCIAALS